VPDCDHLILDGYNLIHKVPQWKAWLSKFPDRAREALADWVRVIHDVDGVRTTLVFDGKGPEVTIEHPFKDETFSYVFSSGGLTADTVIEQMVVNSKNTTLAVVASDDRMLQQTVLVSGAQIMSKLELDGWVTSCERRSKHYLK
jgi:hypothetical protein